MTTEEKRANFISTAIIVVVSILVYEFTGWALKAIVKHVANRELEVYAQELEKNEAEEIKVVWEHKEIVEYQPVAAAEEKIILPEDVANMDGFERDICLVAQTLWGESRGMSDYENSLVAWCICNRVDSPLFPDTVEAVIKQSGQFHGYNANNPVDSRLYKIARDVLIRWHVEKELVGDTGRTLPEDYLYFYGKDFHNKFRTTNSGAGYYDFTEELSNPYHE